MQNVMLSVDNLNVVYETKRLSLSKNVAAKRTISDITFRIKNGETFGLIGESGCGKTTTAKAICGLLPCSGSIKLNGNELSSLSRKKRSSEIQMIFQNPYSSLNPMMRIRQILEEPLIIHGYHSSKERLHKAKEMLSIIGLDESYLSRFVRELSGGQRQRIAIGCALMLNPKLIVADEILSALDVSVQANILNMLTSLNKEMGVSFLFISHDINVVSYFCDRIAVMFGGEIMEVGNAVDIYNSPAHPYTTALIRSVPRMDSVIEPPSIVANDVPKSHCGCAYAKYCPYLTPMCLTESPMLTTIGNRQVRCINLEKGAK